LFYERGTPVVARARLDPALQRPSFCEWRGTTRAEDAQGTPTQNHISPSILVYEDMGIQPIISSIIKALSRLSLHIPPLRQHETVVQPESDFALNVDGWLRADRALTSRFIFLAGV